MIDNLLPPLFALHTHMCISFRDTAASFTARFWGAYWQQRSRLVLAGTSPALVLHTIATDRMQAARITTRGGDPHVVLRIYGRVGSVLRPPSRRRRVWQVDSGVIELGVMCAVEIPTT